MRRAGPIEAASEPVELFQDGDDEFADSFWRLFFRRRREVSVDRQ